MKSLIIVLVLLLSACNSTPNNVVAKDTAEMMRVIALSEAAAPAGVKGTFDISIKASGTQGQVTYLNSELDYRDRRNVTVALHPRLIKELTQLYGKAPKEYFLNKKIKVSGYAKRTKIVFISQGRPTQKYYFQTHIRVSSLKNIELVD